MQIPIHHAENRTMGAVDYRNCGDWVESCSALIEHLDGRISLYRLADDPLLHKASASSVLTP